jgi:hypothetical protein
MCRNIKRLRHPDNAPSDAELHDAALQFVRKISGYHKPSQANARAFDAAVEDVARAGRKLFNALHVTHHSHAHPTVNTIRRPARRPRPERARR